MNNYFSNDFLHLSPLSRRSIIFSPETPGEYVAAIEPAFIADFSNGEVGLVEKAPGPAQPKIERILMDGLMKMLLETQLQFDGIDPYL